MLQQFVCIPLFIEVSAIRDPMIAV